MSVTDISPACTSTCVVIALGQILLAVDALQELPPADLEEVEYLVRGESVDASDFLRHLQYRLDELIDRQQQHLRAEEPGYAYAEF